MMKKYAILALLLALVLVLTGCAQDEARLLERTVVRVGNVGYTYGELLDVEASTRDYYEQMNMLYAMYGLEPQPVSDAQIRDEALNTLAMQAVILDKAYSMGLNELTTEEKREVSARTDEAMAEYRATAAAGLTLPEDATDAEREAAVDAALEAAGVTRAKVYTVQWENFVMEKTQAWAVSGVTVSEEEFMAAFNERVEADKASVVEDPAYYGLMVLNGESPLYAPAGYREVDWLYVAYTEADEALVYAIQNALYTTENDAAAAEETVRGLLGADADLEALLALVNVRLDEVTDPADIHVLEASAAFDPDMSEEAVDAVLALAKLRALETAYDEQLALATDAANAAIVPEVEEILRRLENGEEWARVKEHYNDDVDMYYGSPVVCADFAYVPEGYVNAAMALEAPGDWSEAVYEDGYGCYIILYVGDVTEGPVEPSAVRESMTAELLTTKQDETFSSTLDIWVDAASTKMLINYDILGY